MEVLYKVYDILLPNKLKVFLRQRFSERYEEFKPKYLYRRYLSEFKKYSKIIFRKDVEYKSEYREISKVTGLLEQFIVDSRPAILQSLICSMDKKRVPDDMLPYIDSIRRNGVDYFCHVDTMAETCSDDDIAYSNDVGLYYGLYHGRKLFLSVDNCSQAKEYLQFLLIEQGKDSPHKYLTDYFKVNDGDILFDVGSADGNFTLDSVDRASKCYLFEPLEEWIKPLNNTFDSYKDTVRIINKYVSDETKDDSITIDDFCNKEGIDHIDILKADIEGGEEKMLRGAERMIKEGRIQKICICTYHLIDAQKIISDILPMYDKEMSNGYMIYSALVGPIEEMREPYLVKGVMRAMLREDYSPIH